MRTSPASGADAASPIARSGAALLVSLGLAATAYAQAPRPSEVPLPPPPPGTSLKKPPAPGPDAAKVPPLRAGPAVPEQLPPPGPPPEERCVHCHGAMLRKRVVHKAVDAESCKKCHLAAAKPGKCRSRESSGWALSKPQPDLCYSCHKRVDTAKEVHTAVRVGECLECHAPHSSDLPALLTKPEDQLCFTCHEVEPLVGKKAVKHAPVAEGRCLTCHDPHGSDLPKAVRASGKELCLRCHAATAPTGRKTPGPAYRVDLAKPVVHMAIEAGDCTDCHVAGHGGDLLRLLKEAPPGLCYGCHDRKDTQPFVHGAVRVGDCAVCHDPHSSAQPKLLTQGTQKDLCFTCHADDVTGRGVIHKPVADGRCMECHGPHGGPFRENNVKGEGKQACYACHKVMDAVKVRHGAIERYGCTGCHDPHGTANRSMLAKDVNALCTTCHPDKPDGRHVTTFVAGGHVVAGLLDPRRPGRPFSCASCHNPHGSDHVKLFYLGESALESCDGCHGNRSGKNPGAKNIIGASRPGTTGAGSGGAGGGAGGGGDGTGSPPLPQRR